MKTWTVVRSNMESEVIKRCFKCGETKPLSAFYPHPKMADGHVNKCKECNKNDVRENRKLKLEHYRHYDRNRPNLEERTSKENERVKKKTKEDLEFKEKILLQKNTWAEQNMVKRKAHRNVNSAVKCGLIDKPAICSCCNKSEIKIYGHHWSYEDEHVLDVVWLCAKCHGLEHRRINDIERNGSFDDSKSSSEVLLKLRDYFNMKRRINEI